MKYFTILALVFFQCNISFAELECSRDKLKILYINGVRTTSTENLNTYKIILKAIDNIKEEVNKNSDAVSVESIYNANRGVFNDLHELKAGLEEMRSSKKAGQYWKELAKNEVKFISDDSNKLIQLNKKVDEAFDQIYGRNYQFNLKTKVVDQDYFTKTDLFAVLSTIDYRLANILANAAASEEVIEYLKNKIVESFDGGRNKVMVIAHSQGNVVLSNAESRLSHALAEDNYDTKYSWYKAISGHVQLAPPSPYLASLNSQYIRPDADLVIKGAPYNTGVAPLYTNYNVVPSIDTFSGAIAASNALAKAGDRFGHGVDEIYLSNAISAIRGSDGSSKTMLEHFKQNVIEVASKLKSNCTTTLQLKQARCDVILQDSTYKATGEILSFDFNTSNANQN